MQSRILRGEPKVGVYLNDPNKRLPKPKRKFVNDSARGWNRKFDTSKMQMRSTKPVTVFRGYSQRYLKNGQIEHDPRFYASDDFAFVDHVMWVTRDFEEAKAYAARGPNKTGKTVDFIVEYQFPAYLYFERNENEGFVLPESFYDLCNFVVGVHFVRTEAYLPDGEMFDETPYFRIKKQTTRFSKFKDLDPGLLGCRSS